MYSIKTEKTIIEEGILNVLKAISKAKRFQGSFIISEETGEIIWPVKKK
ncbi:hypothetical protein [Leptospira sp. 'Mane']